MNIFYDSHIHFIPESIGVHTAFYKGIWSDKEKLYQFLEEENIKQALLVYPSTDAHLKLKDNKQVCDLYNQAIAAMIKENKKIIAAGIVDVSDPNSLKDQVKKLHDQGFLAISSASSYDGKFIIKELEPIFQEAESLNMVIFVHPQTINPIGFERVKDPLLMPVLEYSMDSSMFLGLLMMEGILEKYQVKFIFPSLAGVIPFLKERFDRVYPMLLNRRMVKDLGKMPSDILKKVYVDTAGSSIDNIRMAIDTFGLDHILWGSDYPVNVKVKDNLAGLDVLGKEVKGKITADNFIKLFGCL